MEWNFDSINLFNIFNIGNEDVIVYYYNEELIKKIEQRIIFIFDNKIFTEVLQISA
jgi:hypothetical protein